MTQSPFADNEFDPSDAIDPARRDSGRRLDDVLTARGISRARFGGMLAPPRTYQKIWRWTRGVDFSQENRDAACDALGLPRGHFDPVPVPPEDAAEHERQRARQLAVAREARHALDEMLQRPIAAALAPADVALLRSIKFHGRERLPSVAFFEAVAAALLRLIRHDEIEPVARFNAAVDASIAHKRRQRHR